MSYCRNQATLLASGAATAMAIALMAGGLLSQHAVQAKAKAAAPSAPRSAIYRLSARQDTSTRLGITGVPAYVVAPNGSRRGFYITSCGLVGQWATWGLQPGDLLISVDNHSIQGGQQADSALANLKSSSVVVLFARLDDDGRPVFLQKRGTYMAVNAPSSASSGNNFVGASGSGGGGGGGAQSKFPHESLASLEQEMVGLVNRDRAAGHLSALSVNSALSRVARDYAEYMIKTHRFAHVDDQGRDPNARAKQGGINVPVAENLSAQPLGMSSEREIVASSESQMMNEPPNQQNHRGNILDANAQFIGIGMARDGKTLMIVQEFTAASP